MLGPECCWQRRSRPVWTANQAEETIARLREFDAIAGDGDPTTDVHWLSCSCPEAVRVRDPGAGQVDLVSSVSSATGRYTAPRTQMIGGQEPGSGAQAARSAFGDALLAFRASAGSVGPRWSVPLEHWAALQRERRGACVRSIGPRKPKRSRPTGDWS